MTALQDCLSRLDGKAELTADDALTLRRIIFGGDDAVSLDEAEALIQLNADAGAVSPEWTVLFIEALTDFTVHQQAPNGYVDETKANWLMGAVSRGDRAREDEIDLLIHVLDQADSAPDSLSAFVLAQLRAGILARAANGIAEADVERLRLVLFAVGGTSNIAVSRDEANALFDLNDAASGAPNAPTWSDFFARAVGNSVLYAPTWQAPSAAEELAQEAELADNSAFFKGFKALLHPKEAAELIRSPHESFYSEEQKRNLADAALEAAAEMVTAEEAAWLIERIDRDGVFDEAERALVAFLVANARSLDPAFQPLAARLSGVAAPVTMGFATPDTDAAPRATFGRRAAS
jgi:hypothetical protein